MRSLQIHPLQTSENEWSHRTSLVLGWNIVHYHQLLEQRHVARDDGKQGIFEWMLVAHRQESQFPKWSPTKSMVQIEEIFEIVGKRVNATDVLVHATSVLMYHCNHLFIPFSAEALLIEHTG